jgi:hypothetical protein
MNDRLAGLRPGMVTGWPANGRVLPQAGRSSAEHGQLLAGLRPGYGQLLPGRARGVNPCCADILAGHSWLSPDRTQLELSCIRSADYCSLASHSIWRGSSSPRASRRRQCCRCMHGLRRMQYTKPAMWCLMFSTGKAAHPPEPKFSESPFYFLSNQHWDFSTRLVRCTKCISCWGLNSGLDNDSSIDSSRFRVCILLFQALALEQHIASPHEVLL